MKRGLVEAGWLELFLRIELSKKPQSLRQMKTAQEKNIPRPNPANKMNESEHMNPHSSAIMISRPNQALYTTLTRKARFGRWSQAKAGPCRMAELCPGGHWYDCRCKPPQEMIVNNGDGFALYPGMGMFRAGECLICPSRETGMHAWQALIKAYPATRISRRELERHLFIKGGRNMFISFSDESGVPCVLIWSVGNTHGHCRGSRHAAAVPQQTRKCAPTAPAT